MRGSNTSFCAFNHSILLKTKHSACTLNVTVSRKRTQNIHSTVNDSCRKENYVGSFRKVYNHLWWMDEWRCALNCNICDLYEWRKLWIWQGSIWNIIDGRRSVDECKRAVLFLDIRRFYVWKDNGWCRGIGRLHCQYKPSIFLWLLRPLFFRCHPYRFKCTGKELFAHDKDSIEQVKGINWRLCFQVPATKLRCFTHFRTKQANEPIWGSSFHMLQGYIDIGEHIPDLCIPELKELPLDETELEDIKALRKKIAELDSATAALQKQSTTITKTRALLDAISRSMPRSLHVLIRELECLRLQALNQLLKKVENRKESTLSLAKELAISILPANIQSSKRRNDEGHNRYFEIKA